MDDLAGLSFTSTPSSSSTSNYNTPGSKQPQQPAGRSSAAPSYSNVNFAALRPTPASSAATSQRGTSPSNVNGASKPATDSFANLLNFGRNNANNTANLSLQEQQRRLQEAKAKAEEEKRKQVDAQFGNSEFWDNLGGGVSNASGSGAGTGTGGALASLGFKVPAPSSKSQPVVKQEDDDEDLFAAFRASAPVDKTSHFPPPASGVVSTSVTPRFGTPAPPLQQARKTDRTKAQDMDDPFDLMNIPSRSTPSAPPQPATASNDDDDFLGLLGKPVSELPKPPVEQPKQEKPPTPSPAARGDPRDAAIAELMEMGFSLAQSRKALSETDTGLDVQQAVGWLLNEAHRQSKAVSGSSSTSTPGSSRRDGSRGPTTDRRGGHREDSRRDASSSRRRDGSEQRQPAWASSGGNGGGEKDIAAIASEVGSNLFKSANSLWSVGKKRMEKAMKELQQAQGEGGGGEDTPKWMRDAQMYQREEEARKPSPDSRDSRREGGAATARGDHDRGDRTRAPEQQKNDELLTDEALMLEIGSGPPPRKPAARNTDRHHQPHPEPPSRGQSVSPLPLQARQSPVDLQRQRQLDFAEQIRKKEIELREREAKIAMERKAKLGRAAVEEGPEAYISPARRRAKAGATPVAVSKVEEGDLLGGAGTIRPTEPPRNQFQQQRGTPSSALPSKLSAPTPVRKAPSKRHPVAISPGDLAKSTQSRLKGSEAFKLGDYGLALTHYSSALTPLPPTHTLRILLLCNRAICNLKVGDAKACLVDCEDALNLIGEGKGDGEMVFVGPSEEKDMGGFWEKAIARKAEGLEALEKWADAGKAWGTLVESGKGGPNALKGRARCEKAIAPKPPPAAPRPQQSSSSRRQPPPQSKPRPSAPPTLQSQEAVNKLREANNAAEAIEREKLALYDGVTERINSWKKGKEGNLRALLTSLDQILWEGSGWQKISMGQLVIPSKVKIWYMKGIAKVHPDKIPQDATTEQRMISGTVFSLLNEAWDKFKVDNNL